MDKKEGKLSYITPKDVWRDLDNIYFYRYCTHDLRLRFYHALAMDATARPTDLLALKIGGIEFKKDAKGNLYTPLIVGKYGKRKKTVQVGMAAVAIRFYREYLDHDHPDPHNPNAYVFASKEYSAKNRKPIPHISVGRIRASYYDYRDKRVPAL